VVVTTADGHRGYAAIGYGGQLIEVVPDLDLVAVVASTDAVGAAGPEVYLGPSGLGRSADMG
jgi:hypothetical protein